MNLKLSLKPCLVALALSALIAGCSSTQTATQATALTTAEAFAPLDRSLSAYEDLLSSASDDTAFNAMVLLARAQIVSKQYANAAATIEAMKGSALTPLQSDEARIVEALLFTAQQDYLRASANLNAVNEMTLPLQVLTYFCQLDTRVNEQLYEESANENYLERAFASQLNLLSIIDAQGQPRVLKDTVSVLKHYPTSRLAALQAEAADPLQRGFYAYAIADSSVNPEIKERLLDSFKAQFPDHPLAALSTSGSENTGATAAPQGLAPELKAGDRVAVLLPLSGRFAASVGEPARLGVLAALQDIKPDLKVVFYDTAKLSIPDIVADAQRTGTDFILGPVLKPEVDALLSAKAGIPTVLLNRADSALPAHTYYLDLSPEYEGALAASKMALDGVRNPAVVTSASSRSQRAAGTFVQKLRSASGQSPYVCRFNNLDDVKSSVAACDLKSRDGVYIAASALEASEIKALLPAIVPAYITDQSFTGVNASSLEVTMYGAYLGDMPWLITESELKSSMMQNLPKADPQVQRIFAASYDALAVALNLNRLSMNPTDVLHGLTGDISLGANGLLESAPLWVKVGTTVRE
ncbi:MAG TPA: penicillin-binding protein activator [Candidatus Avisuccinivibrio pullicola]|nr:penicillin-binding protein activator [Candidatus Avisuccinivibrio pullicola]